MVTLSQGQIWWADLAEPGGSEPGYRRPVVVVQGEAFNRSRITTVVCVAVTSSLRRAADPGNVLLSAGMSGLPRDSVANVSQIITLDRASLSDYVASLPGTELRAIQGGIDLVLGRSEVPRGRTEAPTPHNRLG